MALTLGLATVLVINRLGDYFTNQENIELDQRSKLVATYVFSVADNINATRPAVARDGVVDGVLYAALSNQTIQRLIADKLAQADVTITFGWQDKDGEVSKFVPARNSPIAIPLEDPPATGQTQAVGVEQTMTYGRADAFRPYAFTVTLSDPYTFRANVTGIMAAVALFALGLSVLVSAGMARRFTTP
ncbi:MAG TPA: hypothetical protein VFV29_07155, partial [Actinomycetota bacterium]|nr:hypothetical protein [Actinomycetota bacterium]